MKVAILDDYQDAVRALDCFALLDGHAVKVFHNTVRGVGQLAIRLQPFEALVLTGARSAIARPLLARLPNLRLIVQAGPAGGHVDLAAAAERGVAVAAGGDDPHAPAELAWALVLAAQRKLLPYCAHLREGLWQTASTAPAYNTLGVGLRGRTLGIWGYGRVGALVAGYGRAFGMDVLVWGGADSRARARAAGLRAAATRAALFEGADVLSLHLRLAPATEGVVGAADLARMRPHALLVNTAHAALIAEGALETALRAGRPGAAALDVFRREPPEPGDTTLLRLPNVLATPHLGYVSRDHYELLFRAAFDSLNAFVAGQPRGIVNPDYVLHTPAS